MSDELNPSTASPGSPPRRTVVVVGIVVVLIVALVAVLFTIDTGDGFGLLDSDSVALSYLSIFLLIAGDAVIPIFPGKDIPAARFWSLTLYDNQSRSMLQTEQLYPRAGSQEYPSPAAEAEADGSTVVYISPAQPDGVAPGNWIQTDPEKSLFVMLRLYSPLPSFFDKTWKAGEFELVS